MAKGRRKTIVQQVEEEDEEYDDEDAGGSQRPNLNTRFLGRVLQGVSATNQRKIDSNQALAASKAMSSSGAASMKLQLQRAVKSGPSAVRRVALSAAARQRLTLCTALLAEVAQGFGFRLSILQPDGNTVSSEEAIAASAAMEEAGGAQDEQQGGGDVQGGEQAACVGDAKQEAPAKQRPKLGALPLQQLNVALDLDPTCASRIEVKSGPSPAGVRPKLSLSIANRLSARALGSLGLIAKKPANAAASTAVAAARKRLLAKRATKAHDDEADHADAADHGAGKGEGPGQEAGAAANGADDMQGDHMNALATGGDDGDAAGSAGGGSSQRSGLVFKPTEAPTSGAKPTDAGADAPAPSSTGKVKLVFQPTSKSDAAGAADAERVEAAGSAAGAGSAQAKRKPILERLSRPSGSSTPQPENALHGDAGEEPLQSGSPSGPDDAAAGTTNSSRPPRMLAAASGASGGTKRPGALFGAALAGLGQRDSKRQKERD